MAPLSEFIWAEEECGEWITGVCDYRSIFRYLHFSQDGRVSLSWITFVLLLYRRFSKDVINLMFRDCRRFRKQERRGNGILRDPAGHEVPEISGNFDRKSKKLYYAAAFTNAFILNASSGLQSASFKTLHPVCFDHLVLSGSRLLPLSLPATSLRLMLISSSTIVHLLIRWCHRQTLASWRWLLGEEEMCLGCFHLVVTVDNTKLERGRCRTKTH